MEESEVGQEAELLRQLTGDPGVVEVDPRDRDDLGVVRGGCTVDSVVVANVWAVPIRSEAIRVRGDGVFPCLEGIAGIFEPRVCEGWGREGS